MRRKIPELESTLRLYGADQWVVPAITTHFLHDNKVGLHNAYTWCDVYTHAGSLLSDILDELTDDDNYVLEFCGLCVSHWRTLNG